MTGLRCLPGLICWGGEPMLTFLLWALVAGIVAVAFWIGHLVRDVNDRFDQIDHALDLILDHVKRK